MTRGPRNRNQAPMTPIGGAGGEAASFTEDGSGAPPARPVVDSGDPRLDCRDARDAGAPTLMGRAGLLLLSGVAADGPGQPWTAGVHAPAACVLLFRAVQGRPGAPVTSHNSCG